MDRSPISAVDSSIIRQAPDTAFRLMLRGRGAWLALLHAPSIGPVTAKRLLERFGSPEDILAASRGELESAGLRQEAIAWLEDPDGEVLERDLAWLQDPNHHLISLQDPAYPPLLRDIPDPPAALFVAGDAQLLMQPQLAIVGSRNPTPGGCRNAEAFARFLTDSGLVVVSGLAIGIDTAAHEGALAGGSTVAVCATGLDQVYPPVNQPLARRIATQGALVSEFPPGIKVRREHFPRRNRVISGLSLGTLVVEASVRSGSLITARQATEQGREVFAIPGSIHSPLSRGCHSLIRQGAKLVESGNDILEEIAPLLGGFLEPQAPSHPAAGDALPGQGTLDADYRALLACLGHDPVAPDTLMRCSGFTAGVVSSMLLMLELEGYVESVAGGYYCRTAKADAVHA